LPAKSAKRDQKHLDEFLEKRPEEENLPSKPFAMFSAWRHGGSG
jgi:hypothetical protein